MGITCIIACITDIKFGLIKNKVLLLSLLFSLVLDVTYYGYFVNERIIEFLLNVVAVFSVSIILYAFKIWGGGDAKLMLLVGLSLPATNYFYYSNEILPTLNLFIFIFSIGYIYLLLETVLLLLRKEKPFVIKNGNKIDLRQFIKNYLLVILYITFINQLYVILLPNKLFNNNVLLMFINVLLSLIIVEYPIFKNKILLYFCGSIAVLLMVKSENLITVFNWQAHLSVSVLLILRRIIQLYNYRRLKIQNLKVGMLLSAPSTLQFIGSRIKNLPKNMSEDLSAKLSEDNIVAINKFYKANQLDNEIVIVAKVPFSIFIFIGVTIFVILGSI